MLNSGNFCAICLFIYINNLILWISGSSNPSLGSILGVRLFILVLGKERGLTKRLEIEPNPSKTGPKACIQTVHPPHFHNLRNLKSFTILQSQIMSESTQQFDNPLFDIH